MLSNVFRRFVDLSPKLSFMLWKYFYELSAIFFRRMSGWKFMNYGYATEETFSADYNTLSGNLYRYLADQIRFKSSAHILEVGSGRGGGCELLLEYNPSSVTGLDFSSNAIKFCRKNYQEKRLKFETGSAENLPFADNFFDVIVNVESSHCYGNRTAFFKEVSRSLKPSGYFLYADFMGRIHYPKRPAQLLECGLEIVSEQEITQQVLKSMELSKSYKENLLKKMVLKPFRNSVADFLGLPGSNIYNKLAGGETIYFAIICQKPVLK